MYVASPRWLVGLLVLLTILPFQNCSENLPQTGAESASSNTPSPPGPSDPIVTLNSVTAGPSAVLPGSVVALSARATANKNLVGGVLKLTVKNSAQTQVWTQSFPNQNFAANVARDIVQNFATPETLPAGLYSVSAEMLSTDLSRSLVKRDNLATIDIRPPVRVSVGNTAPYIDTLGRVWAADFGFTGSSVPTTERLLSVEGTDDPALYSSFRYGQNPASMTFTTPIPSPGKYKVTLKWTEHYVFGPNLRIFSVSINGTTVLQDFDLFVEAGGAYIAYDRTFTVTANSQVQITFSSGPIENPKINAIEVVGAP